MRNKLRENRKTYVFLIYLEEIKYINELTKNIEIDVLSLEDMILKEVLGIIKGYEHKNDERQNILITKEMYAVLYAFLKTYDTPILKRLKRFLSMNLVRRDLMCVVENMQPFNIIEK